MEKKVVKKTIQEPKEIDTEVYVTKDGREFENEQLALEHEKVGIIKSRDFKSKILNNNLITQFMSPFRIVRFDNENQVEAFEQKMCGNKDNNTWGSWVSCRAKFDEFPCWIVYNYVNLDQRKDDYTDNGYSAIYLTPKEAKDDLLDVIKQIELITK